MLAREDDLTRILTCLRLTATRKFSGLLHGSFLSIATEEGPEPVGSREYVISDDVRQINWVAITHTGASCVRISEVECELECWIIAELAACLSMELADTIKRHLFTAAAGAITILNDALGSRAGLIAGDTPMLAGQDRAYSLMLLKQLADATAEYSLATGTDTVVTQAPRVGLLVVISDFLGLLNWAHPLRVASALTEIMAIRLVDPVDGTLSGESPAATVDLATGEAIELDINDKTRTKYAAQANAHYERVISELCKYRARVIILCTGFDQILDSVRQIGQRWRLSNRLLVLLLGHQSTGYNHWFIHDCLGDWM